MSLKYWNQPCKFLLNIHKIHESVNSVVTSSYIKDFIQAVVMRNASPVHQKHLILLNYHEGFDLKWTVIMMECSQ